MTADRRGSARGDRSPVPAAVRALGWNAPTPSVQIPQQLAAGVPRDAVLPARGPAEPQRDGNRALRTQHEPLPGKHEPACQQHENGRAHHRNVDDVHGRRLALRLRSRDQTTRRRRASAPSRDRVLPHLRVLRVGPVSAARARETSISSDVSAISASTDTPSLRTDRKPPCTATVSESSPSRSMHPCTRRERTEQRGVTGQDAELTDDGAREHRCGLAGPQRTLHRDKLDSDRGHPSMLPDASSRELL